MTAAILTRVTTGRIRSPVFQIQAVKIADKPPNVPEHSSRCVGLMSPRRRILWNVLLDPQRGLFFCQSVLLLSI